MNKPKTLRGLFARARSRDILIYLVCGLILSAAVILSGDDIAHHINAIETRIAHLGPWGALAFVGLFIVATSLLMPETVLSIMAGALFGFAWGLGAVFVGSLLASAWQYALSRKLLRSMIEKTLATKPSLAAIQKAVVRDEFKLQSLLRLTPLNPATTSYMLGAAGVRFPGFLLACLAMIPTMVVEVYFGYAGKHVAHMAARNSSAMYLHDAIVFIGLAVTIGVVVMVSRLAHKAVMEAVAETMT